MHMPSLSLSAFVTLAAFLTSGGFSVTAAQEASPIIIIEEQEDVPNKATVPWVQIEIRVIEIEGALPEQIQNGMIDLHERIKTQLDFSEAPETTSWQSRRWGTMAILTAPDAARALETLSATPKTDILTLPSVRTISGRAARIAVEAQENITDPPFKAPLRIDTRGLCQTRDETFVVLKSK